MVDHVATLNRIGFLLPEAEARLVWNASEKLCKAERIIRQILEADERGQGVRYAEAMDAAKAFLQELK